MVKQFWFSEGTQNYFVNPSTTVEQSCGRRVNISLIPSSTLKPPEIGGISEKLFLLVRTVEPALNIRCDVSNSLNFPQDQPFVVQIFSWIHVKRQGEYFN